NTTVTVLGQLGNQQPDGIGSAVYGGNTPHGLHPSGRPARRSRYTAIRRTGGVATTLVRSPTVVDTADTGIIGPLFPQQTRCLVTERVDSAATGQAVRQVHVQTLDPMRHTTRADLVPEGFERITSGQVGLVRP